MVVTFFAPRRQRVTSGLPPTAVWGHVSRGRCRRVKRFQRLIHPLFIFIGTIPRGPFLPLWCPPKVTGLTLTAWPFLMVLLLSSALMIKRRILIPWRCRKPRGLTLNLVTLKPVKLLIPVRLRLKTCRLITLVKWRVTGRCIRARWWFILLTLSTP